jgi:hypothetical protein
VIPEKIPFSLLDEHSNPLIVFYALFIGKQFQKSFVSPRGVKSLNIFTFFTAPQQFTSNQNALKL